MFDSFGGYDFFMVNFFPLIGLSFLMYFLWRNAHLEKRIRNRFFFLSGLICIELMIYNLELYFSVISGYVFLHTLITAIGYSLRPFMMYQAMLIVFRHDERKTMRIPLLIPVVLNVAFAFSAFFTKLGYYYDQYGKFHRGPYGWIPHIIVFTYLLVLMTITFAIKDKRRSFERTTVLLICTMIMFGAMAESVFNSYAVLRVAIVAGLIFYYMFFQSERYRDEIIEKHVEQTQMSERLTLQMVMALARTVDAKDSYTNGHSQRVAEYAREIAKRLDKSEDFQREIYYMGLLHDIGKIGVPDHIINKTSRLTDEEFSTIKSHPVIGAEVLQDITEMPNLYYGARWHHERYDGKGYPDGLRGDQIPVEARIIAVADCYDAMTSKRSYRDVLPQSVVRSELARAKRTQLDPFMANIMLEMMDEDPDYNMKENSSKKVDNILEQTEEEYQRRQMEKKAEEEKKKAEKKPVDSSIGPIHAEYVEMSEEERINAMTEQLRRIIKSEPENLNSQPVRTQEAAYTTPYSDFNNDNVPPLQDDGAEKPRFG